MAKTHLTIVETVQMLLHVCHGMQASKDLLSEADRAIGDGDHGVGMARGFEVAQQRLESQPATTLEELFKTVGMALLTSVGGAAGAVFGTLFRGGARGLAGREHFDAAALASWLNDGLKAVQERGKAQVGDKTMVDALQPAAARAQELVSLPLEEALPQVAEAARQGVERTKDMVATVGKAKTLGERALGHPDPGALSTYLILQYMAEYVAGRSDTATPP
ncbi:MAG: dihydroxyacetone kinase subunit L [Ardenticatenia bacterium]|jgi:dihydroxyacetone kinase-like protein|nr:MAG: dihydroxyacetone kinase subunit L [Ardenticatenia bacterium]